MPASRAVRSRLPAAAVRAAGWGAHQFTSLAVYRTREHWPAVPVATMFTTYLLGLPRGQLLGGPAADRLGRCLTVRPRARTADGAGTRNRAGDAPVAPRIVELPCAWPSRRGTAV
ncbi:hypothetical protein [Streptomyces sp. NPDC055105]|uniref:hypothetical protein n=1 Tax=Streptomyces sp. NPDC055105 TaxID=3365719 RepID=UPI0037D0DF95